MPPSTPSANSVDVITRDYAPRRRCGRWAGGRSRRCLYTSGGWASLLPGVESSSAKPWYMILGCGGSQTVFLKKGSNIQGPLPIRHSTTGWQVWFETVLLSLNRNPVTLPTYQANSARFANAIQSQQNFVTSQGIGVKCFVNWDFGVFHRYFAAQSKSGKNFSDVYNPCLSVYA